VIRVRRYPTGYRLWIRGARVHHGTVGCLLIVFRRTRLAGLLLMAHDLRDRHQWFRLTV
jgi:hypothetical protein